MKITWTDTQVELLHKIEIPFDVLGCLTDEQIFDLDDYVSNYMLMYWVKNDVVFGDGLLCESILDVLGEL